MDVAGGKSNTRDNETSSLIYNRPLFESMAAYVEAVWEVDVVKGTVFIIHDKITPALNNRVLSIEEVIAYSTDKCHPKYKDSALFHLKDDFLKNIKQPLEYEIKTLVGDSYRTLKCSVVPVINEFGDTQIVYVTSKNVHDLDDETIAKETVESELDRYFTSVPCGVVQYTRDTHKLVYVNDMALDILGYSSMEEMQEDGFDGVVKTVNEKDSEKIKELIKNINSEEKTVECEYRVHHKDGKELICMGKIRLIDRGDKEPIIQRSMIDVTAMRKAGNMYKQVADTLAVANMGLWYMILDEGKPKFYVDEIVARLVGTSLNTMPEEAYSTWYSNLNNEAKEIANEAVVKMRNGHPAEATYEYNHPTRGKIIIRCGGLKDKSYSGKGILIRGYHQDITEYNDKLIEQIEVSKAANNYFSGVCDIDLKKGTTKFLSNLSGHFAGFISKDRPIEAVMDILGNSVLEESRQEFRKLLNNEYLKNKLTEKPSFTMNLNMKDGAYKMIFVATRYDDKGQVERCMLFVEG